MKNTLVEKIYENILLSWLEWDDEVRINIASLHYILEANLQPPQWVEELIWNKEIKYREEQHNKYINQYRKSIKKNWFTRSHDWTRADMCRKFANYLHSLAPTKQEAPSECKHKCNEKSRNEICLLCGAKLKWDSFLNWYRECTENTPVEVEKPVISRYFVVEDWENIEQISIGFDTYEEALKHLKDEYTQKVHPYAYIIWRLKLDQ
jgi:hypothetical protein